MEKYCRQNVLWISLRVPYDKVPHAGGKIHNFYLKRLHETGNFNIKLVSFAKAEDEGKIDLDSYKINNDLIHYKQREPYHLIWAIMNRLSKPYMKLKYASVNTAFEVFSVMQKIKNLKRSGYVPDVVILHWTNIVLLASKIKRLYPNAKFVAIEEDVYYLGYKRRFELAQSRIEKIVKSFLYKRLRKIELAGLKCCELAILNNPKDEKLINSDGIDRTWHWAPYFQSMIEYERKNPNKNILFYGAMYREENWRSAIWFIENVFSRILDVDIQLYIIGHNPPELLKKYDSERIHIKGYVEDVSIYFKESMCLVAPLLLGAGVKIKIIEGLSAGIPVLTNLIGIEGIPAVDKKDYFYCDEPEKYLNVISDLASGRYDLKKIEHSSKQFIMETYDFENDAKEFSRKTLTI